MKIRMLVLALIMSVAGAILTASTSAQTQPAKTRYRVGWLNTAAPGSLDEAFCTALRRLGYVEGQTIAIDSRWAEGKFDRLPAMAAELAGLRVDVIMAGGTPAALAAQKATTDVPIVMVVGTDPVAVKLVESLARPGHNVTGLTRISPDLAGKRVELLKETLPKLSRLAVLWHDASNPFTASVLQETRAAAVTTRLQLQSVEVRGARDLDGAFAAMAKAREDAVIVVQDGLTIANQSRIVKLAAQHRLPAIYESRDWTMTGGLMAYGANDEDLYRRAATYVDKIFRGTRPGDLPVEQPTKFDLIINLATAKALGLTIPQSILVRADEIIQ